MNALLQPGPPTAHLRVMHYADLDEVMQVEQSAYSFPWTRGNFVDSLASGYLAEMLRLDGGALVGYYLAMAGVDEMHLLNLTVTPAYQRRGYARQLLEALERRCLQQGLPRLWLEVRASNARAREIYLQHGFAEVGQRRGYYPADKGRREDAVVMSLQLQEA